MKTLLAFLLLLGSAVAQNHYYVSPSGSDSNSGTISQPWRTIQHADAALALSGTAGSSNCGHSYGSWQGDTNVAACVHVLAGTYAAAELVTTRNGNASQRIVYISETMWGAKLESNTSGFVGIWASHGNFVDIVGFDMTVTMAKNNCVSNAACDGVAGLILIGNSEKAIANNIHNLHGDFADNTCNGNGGGAITSPGGQSDISIIGNFLHNIGASGTGAGFCHFMHNPYVSISNSRIEDNIIAAVQDGIGCTHCSNVIVSNNTLMNIGGFGTTCGSGGSGTQCIGSTAVGFGRCIAFSTPSGTNTIINNLCVNNAANGSNAYADIVAYSGGIAGLISHNIVYNPASGNGSGSAHTASIDAGGGSATISGNLLSNSAGTNDPAFLNYATNASGDYHLKSSSAALGAGTSSCAAGGASPCVFSLDFEGKVEPAPANIGALGLAGAAVLPPAAPTGLTAIVQ